MVSYHKLHFYQKRKR